MIPASIMMHRSMLCDTDGGYMRVLVTGAGGYIGSVATERLISAGHQVIALDSFERGHREAVHPLAEVVTVDLRDAEATGNAVNAAEVDAIMHFAALHLVPESVEKPGEYYRTNVVGGLNLLDAARFHGVERFVFSSTAAVYGEPERSPITEDAPKRPINPYGRSKWMVEQMLSDFSERYGIRYAAFRYFNVAGATERFGEDHRPETHIIPIALQTIMGQREVFKLFGTDYLTPDGTAIRDYVHVADLADAHVLALEKLDTGSLGSINLGTKGGFSVQEIVDAVQHVLGKTMPVERSGRRAGDPAALVADPSRALTELGWTPARSTLEEMVGSAWEWMQTHPRGYDS
jgi:UDP-glucose 4-epimerase